MGSQRPAMPSTRAPTMSSTRRQRQRLPPDSVEARSVCERPLPAGVSVSATLGWLGEWARTAPMWLHHHEHVSAGQKEGEGLVPGASFTSEFVQVEEGGVRVRHEATLTVLELREVPGKGDDSDVAAVVKLHQRTRRFEQATCAQSRRVYSKRKTVKIELLTSRSSGDRLHVRVTHSMELDLAKHRTWDSKLGGFCLMLCGEWTAGKRALFPGRYLRPLFHSMLQDEADQQAGRLNNALQHDQLVGRLADEATPVHVATVVGVKKVVPESERGV